MAPSSWKTLGIAPTEDKRAIKRAYAAKLKATDVENDPRAFIELREALETATWEADYLQYQDQHDDDAGLADAEPMVVEVAPIRDEELAVAEPNSDYPDDNDYEDPATWRWEPERQPETEADQERIVQLLWGDAPVDEIEVELAERTHNILTAPAMEAIDHASAIEDWMASIIAQSIPRSDVMARIAVPHFGWEEHADDWRQRYGVSAAAARLRDLDALDRLRQPDHRWNQAFELLRQPPPDANGWKAVAKHKKDVLALLESIRHHTPALEHELDADHVAQWEPALAASGGNAEKKSGWGFKWWWWVLIALWAFIQIARSLGDIAPEPKSDPPVAEAAYQLWRAEQLPPVQQWMDANRDAVDRLFADQKARGPGLPICSALDAVAPLTKAQYDHCAAAEEARKPLAAPAIAMPAAPNPVPQQAGSRKIYSSPQWRSEQAPRVQSWMDKHPATIDVLLRPHLKAGGLPGCDKLAAVAKLSPSEFSTCRAAQERRQLRDMSRATQSGPPPVAVMPEAPKPGPIADICDKPGMAEQPVCQDGEVTPPTPAN